MKILKDLWFALTVALLLLLVSCPAKAGINDSQCAPVDVVMKDMAMNQFSITRIDYTRTHAVVTYTRGSDTVRWVMLPNRRACLLREVPNA